MASVFTLLHPSIRSSLMEFGIHDPTPPQVQVIPQIISGENILLIAPTASGKTEAALLPVFDGFLRQGVKQGISIIYITPLRALNRDIHKRMVSWAERLGIDVQVRHSDTTQRERRSQLKKPPQLLITTPETFQAIIPVKAMRRHLQSVRWVIIDEIHELASSKRGSQLMVGLERLERLTLQPFQRIGLSATVGNSTDISDFLGGGHHVKVVEVKVDKDYIYDVEYPEQKEEDFDLSSDLNTTPIAASRLRTIRDLVRSHRSTLIFVQGRGQAESLGHKLGMLDDNIEVHHGSLSREQRHLIEDRFKSGELKAIVCTSTLQLGIDIGDVDLTVQYNSPRQVTTLIQRVGRAGHRISKVSQGIVIVSYGEDALESIVTARKAKAQELEPVEMHINPLDVLAHQITGLSIDFDRLKIANIKEIIQNAFPFRGIMDDDFDDVVTFLDAIKVVNRRGDVLEGTKKGRRYYYENLGMINDEKRYPFINVVTDKIIGTVGDEFWTLRARVGLNVILRGRVWKILQIDEDEGRLFVLPSDDPLGALPGWDGELIGVDKNITLEAAELRKSITSKLKNSTLEAVVKGVASELNLSEPTVAIVTKEAEEHISKGFPLPQKDLILLETYDRYLVIHSTYGSKVNATLGCIIDALLSEKDLILGWWNDAYRILIESPMKLSKYDMEDIKNAIHSLTPERAEELLNEFMEARFPYAYNMKFIAERFGAISRGKTYGADALQRLYRRFKNSPIYRETLREIYKEKLDLHTVKELVQGINSDNVKLEYIPSKEPSPLAKHILQSYADIEELMDASIAVPDQLDYMKKSVHSRTVELSCMNCNQWSMKARIRELQEKPICGNCGSSLLAYIRRNYDASRFQALYNKLKSEETLVLEENEILTNGRKTADLVLSYGRKAIEAMSVHGVGPITAYQVLSKMHKDDKTFYQDLLKAKIQYMRTRQYWDDRKERLK